MLQVPNIYKNWKIWIPPTLASAILGPIAILFFDMQNTALESGMGSCGLVGQIGTFNAMKEAYSTSYIILAILGLQIILPMILSYLIYYIMKKKQWIKDGDMKIF